MKYEKPEIIKIGNFVEHTKGSGGDSLESYDVFPDGSTGNYTYMS